MPATEEPFSARSWLFAPGDGDRKMEKAAASPADIVLLDLEERGHRGCEAQSPHDDLGFP